MLVAFSSLLRRCRHGSVRHQFNGAAWQSANDGVSVDLLNGDIHDGRCSSIRALDGAVASTSSSPVPLSKGFTSSCLSAEVFRCFGITARHASSATESHTARRREILRDAAQKVSPDSTWLLAYSNNIDPRQLTYRLGKRSTLHALEEGWALYQHKFDTVAMAALLRRVRVAQLFDPDFDPAAAQRLLNALEPRLRTITIRFGKLRDTIAYLHALAKLRSPPPKAPAGVAGPAETAATDDGVGTTAASSAGSQSGEQLLGQPAELVLDLAVWATRDRTQVLHASPRRLATLLWALLRTLPPEQYGSEKLQMVLDRIAVCSIRQCRNFAPEDMRVYAVAYATFGPRGVPADVSAAAAGPDGSWSRSGRSWLDSMSYWPQPEGRRTAAGGGAVGGAAADASAAGGADAKAEQRRKRNALVLQVVADQLAARVGNLTVAQPEPRDLALTAHAMALQGAPTPHWPLLLKAADAVVAAPPHQALQPLELVLLVEALEKYGIRQPALLEAVRRRASKWAGSGAAAGASAASSTSAGEQQQQQDLYGRLAKAYERLGVTL
ncbi:hypothetical protein PLESTM_001506500 [Pleodorina starrii]|nr:hypothetical protein PLESTM_001506500 [Pleodorina starrii]